MSELNNELNNELENEVNNEQENEIVDSGSAEANEFDAQNNANNASEPTGISLHQVIVDVNDAYKTLTGDETETTYAGETNGIAYKISQIEIGGTAHKILSAVLDSNKSLTATLDDESVVSVVPVYQDGVITSLTVDGVSQTLTYDNNGYLTKVGSSTVSGMSNYPEPAISNIGYTATFMVDSETYYVVSVEQGNSISAPPNPTVETGTFISWQINGSDVTFPYTPSADVTMVANIGTVRTEMEIGKNENICTSGGSQVINNSDDFVIVGVDNVGHTYIFIASKAALNVSGATLKSPGTYDHDGETWYYGCLWSGSDISDKAYIYPTPASQIVDCVQMLIEHYYLEDV